MNRNEDYLELKRELDGLNAPGGSVLRAAARQRKARRSKLFLRPLAGLAAAFAVFVLLVNVSPTVAMACEGIPILGDLAEAVSFSPSLSKAVENDYYQKIDQQQTVDGVTLSVDYVIVDQKSVNVLFHVDGAGDDYSFVSTEVLLADGSRGDYAVENTPDHTTVYFCDQDVPTVLLLNAKVEFSHWDSDMEEAKEWEVGPYAFRLKFDPSFLAQGKHYETNQTMELDGQRIRITGIDVCPSYTNLTVEGDPANTAWLTDLDCYLLAEDGTRYTEVQGITGFYCENGKERNSFHMESSFFHPTDRLTLCVTGAQWSEKNEETVIHLAEGTAEGLPESTELVSCERTDNGWKISLLQIGTDRQCHSIDYQDPNGMERYMTQQCHTKSDPDSLEPADLPANSRLWTYTLEDYPWDEVRLTPQYTHISEYDEPITVDFELK